MAPDLFAARGPGLSLAQLYGRLSARIEEQARAGTASMGARDRLGEQAPPPLKPTTAGVGWSQSAAWRAEVSATRARAGERAAPQ
jgi:hypothetical protein